QEGPSVGRPYAERLEEARGHTMAVEPLRLIAVAQIEGLLLDGDQALEGRVLLAPVREVARRDRAAAGAGLRFSLPHHNQALLIGEVERPQDHRMNDAEDVRSRADSQRRRQRRDERDAGALQQYSYAVANVLP